MYPDQAQLYSKGTGGSLDANSKWVASDDITPIWTGRGDLQDNESRRSKDRTGDKSESYTHLFFFDEIGHPMDIVQNDQVLLVSGDRYRVVSRRRDEKAVNLHPV